MDDQNSETERLRINLLRQCKAVDPLGLTLDALHTGAALQGFDVNQKRILQECDHLADPHVTGHGPLLRLAEAGLARAVRRYKITAAGREWLAEHGF